MNITDPLGATDVHLGLIPLDPSRNNEPFESRCVNHATPSQNLTVFAQGDSWVEWGEARTYDPDEVRDPETGMRRGAPGLHVIVRFPPLAEIVALRLQPVEYLAAKRTARLGALAEGVVEEVFADLLADGYRVCDYAAVTDATDWAERPTWDPRDSDNKVVTFYA